MNNTVTALERLTAQAERLLGESSPPPGGCNDAFRLGQHREPLQRARRAPPSSLPPRGSQGQHREMLAMLSAAVREDLQARAELAALTRDQLATVLAALDDAAESRDAHRDVACADCNVSPSGLCYDHACSADAADAYRVLRAQLGGAS